MKSLACLEGFTEKKVAYLQSVPSCILVEILNYEMIQPNTLILQFLWEWKAEIRVVD